MKCVLLLLCGMNNELMWVFLLFHSNRLGMLLVLLLFPLCLYDAMHLSDDLRLKSRACDRDERLTVHPIKI